ncbi:MAG: response regulator [Methanomassiliicoccus sp.]|nr:response regulator [Methanomassiliicoccus sp.]
MEREPVHIMILEDSESDLELMKRELRGPCPNAILDWAPSKRIFLQLLDHVRPNIVLLDYSVPGFDGMTAMGMVRERFPETPIIIVSGGIGEETAIGTLKAGATDYVLKKHLHRIGPVVMRALQEREESEERRRVEEALTSSRRRFESLFSSSNEGIALHEMVYDDAGRAVDYRVLDVNPAFESITGISRKNAAGMLATELFGTIEAPFIGIYNDVVETGVPYQFETNFAPMGKYFLISAFSPEEGQFATMFVDVTDRISLESQLKKKAEDLARSNAELQQFAYVASHDLQEPLRMVSAHLDLLSKRYGDQLTGNAPQHLEFALQGARRMRALINDLLEYSRVESRGTQFAPVSLRRPVQQALENLSAVIGESNTVIEVGELPAVLADESQLVHLFQNLLSNAIKFRGVDPPHVVITALSDGENWLISVRDNGIGMSSIHSERIFQMFQRLHTHDEYPGTGIGLAICKKIVERHGGRIWVESKEGEGSTFFLTLPRTPDVPD